MLRVSIADFAAFIHVEGDLAEVHVVELLVERDRVSADGGNGAPLCLPGIEIRGCEDDLVADAPARGVQDLDRGGAGVGRAGQLGPGVGPVTVKVQGSAHEHDPAVTAVRRSTHSTDVFAFDVVGEGDGRLARVGFGLRVPISNSPCTMIHSVVSSRSLSSAKLSLPLIVKPCSAGGADVEDDVLVPADGDHGVFGRAPFCQARWPDPTSASRWPSRSLLLSLNDGISAEN